MYDGGVQVNLPAYRIGRLRTALTSAERIVAPNPIADVQNEHEVDSSVPLATGRIPPDILSVPLTDTSEVVPW